MSDGDSAIASFWEGIMDLIRIRHSHHHHSDNGGGGGLKPTDALPSVDILTVILLLSAIMYAVCLLWACRKCFAMRSSWNSKRCLLASVCAVCAVRLMTILGVAFMNIMNVRAHYSVNPNYIEGYDEGDSDPHQRFSDKVMTILFDLPNCFVVTTYVLLTLVWAECFLDSRLHTVSSPALRSSWLMYFMAFNVTLYVVQVALYASVFFPTMSRIVESDIYVGITGTNFTAVALVLIFYVYLNILFSGFPYRSQELRNSLSRVSSVMSLWSLTRILWGIATLVVFVKDIELLQDSHTPVWSFVVLLLLFFVCEIVPIIALLDYSYNNMLRMMVIDSDEEAQNDGDEDENVDTTDDFENSIRSWRQQLGRERNSRGRTAGSGDDATAEAKSELAEPLLQDGDDDKSNPASEDGEEAP